MSIPITSKTALSKHVPENSNTISGDHKNIQGHESTRRALLGSSLAIGSAIAVGSGISRSASAKTGAHTKAARSTIAVGAHTLPKLGYGYADLEPYIDAETMHLHHDKHHAGYVKGLNAAEKALVACRKSGDFHGIKLIERSLAFHGNGHTNHTVFWSNMKPAKAAKKTPEGALAAHIAKDLGSLDKLKAHFSIAAKTVEGNGWGALVYHPMFDRLYILSLLNHQNSALNGVVPLLMCDVWEHAYYLKYKNKRADYIKNWWNVVDWANVEARYAAARKMV